MSNKCEITIDDGTILLVAEILRQERNLPKMSFDLAADAITKAAQTLAARRNELSQ